MHKIPYAKEVDTYKDKRRFCDLSRPEQMSIRSRLIDGEHPFYVCKYYSIPLKDVLDLNVVGGYTVRYRYGE